MPNDIKSGPATPRRSVFDRGGPQGFDPRADLPVLALALLTISLGFGSDDIAFALRYERAAILGDAELWRLISGHFVHLGWPHLLLNLAGCLLVWFFFRPDFRPREWLVVTVCSLAVIDAGFLLLHPGLQWYVGLSGLLHGLFAAGMLRWLSAGGWEAWAMLAIFSAKLAWEQLAGPLPLTEDSAGGPVIVDAHLYGALGGLLGLLLLGIGRRIRAAYNAGGETP